MLERFEIEEKKEKEKGVSFNNLSPEQQKRVEKFKEKQKNELKLKRKLQEKNSIIPFELKHYLQENFDEFIPQIFEKIIENNVKVVILSEKTGRLFKKGFNDILRGYDIKIIGIDPNNVTDKKIKFLETLSNENVLIFDEMIVNKKGVNKLIDLLSLYTTGKILDDNLSDLFNKGWKHHTIIESAIYTPSKKLLRKETLEDSINDMKLSFKNFFNKKNMNEFFFLKNPLSVLSEYLNKPRIKNYKGIIVEISNMMQEALRKKKNFKE